MWIMKYNVDNKGTLDNYVQQLKVSATAANWEGGKGKEVSRVRKSISTPYPLL